VKSGGIFSVGLHRQGIPTSGIPARQGVSGLSSQTHPSPSQMGQSVGWERLVVGIAFMVVQLLELAHVHRLFASRADVEILGQIDWFPVEVAAFDARSWIGLMLTASGVDNGLVIGQRSWCSLGSILGDDRRTGRAHFRAS
jgi:hypothetical protein